MAVGSSQSSNIYPPQSPTRITNNSILKLSGAFHCVKTSSIGFWAFSYSIGDPCGRSNQLIMYFIGNAVNRPVKSREQSLGMSEEKIGQLRFVGTAGTLGDHR